ncbi:MAG: MBL fold metallo-hydrolase, partial [Pseudomonadota bacterium]
SDHLTGLDGLKERFRDALTVVGEGAQEFLSHPKSPESIVPEDRHMSEFLNRMGFPPGRPPVDYPPSLDRALIAAEDDTIDLGGLTLHFLAVGGHSPGALNVYIPELEALIASDSLGYRFRKRGFHPLFLTDYSQYMATMDRLHELKPAILGVAHQGPLVGREVEAAFRQARQAAGAIRDRIRSDSRASEEIAHELLRESYNDEFLLYTEKNIANCCRLLVKRARD